MHKDKQLTGSFLSFLDQSVSPWHVVQECINKLEKAGFECLKEHDVWSLKAGNRYYVTRNRSSICAFIVPSSTPTQARIIAAHTDSPSLKLKPQPEIRKQNMILLGVEIYGAPILASWFNRDLGLAGRVVYYDSKQYLQEALVNLSHYPFVIPQLAIHLDREVNEKGPILNKQDHLNVLAAIDQGEIGTKSYLQLLLKEEIDCQEWVNFDLFFYPLEKSRLVGYKEQFVSAPRLDNLASVHATLEALTQSIDPLENELKMVVFWDNEEIGSNTAQGAASPFLMQIIERILYQFDSSREAYFKLIPASICFSVDLAHAQHPNYMDKHDSQHPILLNKGVVLKTHASQRYASDARSSTTLQTAAKKLDVPIQKFVSRNDVSCGTTIGPIHASLTGMPTVDLGCSQLSMHSSRELMATEDHLYLCQLIKGILSEKQLERILH